MPSTGECNCGAVAYEAETDLSDIFICHCSICRRSTGGGRIAVTIVENDDFVWSRGSEEISYWSKPDHDWHTSFCKICGSSLPGINDETRMYIPIDTLTSGHENLKVVHHIYVNSKASWEEISDSGKQHPDGYEA